MNLLDQRTDCAIKKAVEQIRLAEEVKITKEKIKEVEEEWQSNLLNWKSKRRQTSSCGKLGDDEDESNNSVNSDRKIKTFSEILNEKAKSGHRIGYNLHRYLADGDGDDSDLSEFLSSHGNNSRVQKQDASNSVDKQLDSGKFIFETIFFYFIHLILCQW